MTLEKVIYAFQQSARWGLGSILCLFIVTNCLGQSIISKEFKGPLDTFQVSKSAFLGSDLLKINTFSSPDFPLQLPEKKPPYSTCMIPQWSADELPFFCRIEHKWSKSIKAPPMKFRLGSVDYVDWLEGKSFDRTRN
ncbi:MAG: hypothetical protein H6576_16915 [Lewinellaceae bacterium]|nr:hypothetical protein [Saprospiraceae bacterium]MCB9345372.1 hypothetical protein [Lewinellaceae bacterium]